MTKPMHNTVVWDDNMDRTLRKYKIGGSSTVLIAERMGISVNSVNSRMSVLGMRETRFKRAKRINYTPEMFDTFKKLRATMTRGEIATEMGISYYQVDHMQREIIRGQAAEMGQESTGTGYITLVKSCKDPDSRFIVPAKRRSI